jgi:hypothetical protein
MDTPKSRAMRHEDSVKTPFFVRFLEAQRRRRGEVAGLDDVPGEVTQDAADGDHAALKCPSERDAG